MLDEAVEGLPVLALAQPEEWWAWLESHHATARGAWLRFRKQGAGGETSAFRYPQAVEGALCYGWIDGQARSEGNATYRQKFTPRGRRSLWSRINREKALALIEAGRMQPAGLAEVERARADGRWDAAYTSPSQSEVPEDLRAALDASPAAAAAFAGLDSRNRYAILFRLQTARKPETRTRRLREFVAMLERGEVLQP